MDAVRSRKSKGDTGETQARGEDPGCPRDQLRLLVIGIPDFVHDTLLTDLLPAVPGLELITSSADSPPVPSERFHAIVIDAPAADRYGAEHWRRVTDRFPETPILVLRPHSTTDPTSSAIPVDPHDKGQLVETIRAVLEGSALRDRLGASHAALRKFEERSRFLSQATGEAAWDWDLQTGRVWRGGAYEQLCGYTPEEISSDLDWWKERVHPEDRAAVIAAFDAALVGEEQELVLLYRLRRRDGSYAHVLDRGFVLQDQSRPARIVGFAREVVAAGPFATSERGKPNNGAGDSRAPDTALARLSAVEWLTDASLAHLSLEHLLTELLSRLRAAVGGDAAMAHLLTEDRTELYCHSSVGIERRGPMPIRIPFGQGIIGKIAATGQVVQTQDIGASGAVPTELNLQFRSLIGVPIILDGKVTGALTVATRDPRGFKHQDRRLLELVADRMAPAFDRAKLLHELRLDRERLEALSRRLVSSQEEERRRVSRELHDEIGQLLTSLKLALKPGTSSQISAEEITQELFHRVRDISMSLRPPTLDDLGLTSAIAWHCERFTAQTGIRVNLTTSGLARRLSPDVELNVFRIVQEALTNVARHAQVSEAHVTLKVVSGWLEAHVIDLGPGFDVRSSPPGRSSGLTGMRERANLVNGRFSIQSEPGVGTRLLVRVPVNAISAPHPGRGPL